MSGLIVSCVGEPLKRNVMLLSIAIRTYESRNPVAAHEESIDFDQNLSRPGSVSHRCEIVLPASSGEVSLIRSSRCIFMAYHPHNCRPGFRRVSAFETNGVALYEPLPYMTDALHHTGVLSSLRIFVGRSLLPQARILVFALDALKPHWIKARPGTESQTHFTSL